MQKKTKSLLRVPYAQTVYGKSEIAAVNRVLKNPSKISPGDAVKEFENKIAALFGKKHGIMVNSGSSANLLAVEALELPPGSEVITPILTFATTVAPLVQKGLVPVFVDIEEGTYLANINQIERAITKKTSAVIIPSLIGNVPDLVRLRALAKKHKFFIIEDSCDTLGAKFAGKPTGVYSDVSTTSFYASHIITTAGAGGMVSFADDRLARRARILAAWGRESTLFGVHERSEDITKRFAGRLDGEVYDAKFLFTEIGYNFQSSELNAAFGLEQLKRLKEFTKLRKKHFVKLLSFFKRYENLFILPRQLAQVDTAWLSFPLTLRAGAPFTRAEITRYLEEHNIQTRPIFTGTILKQPAFRKIKHRNANPSFPVSDHVMRNGFLIGAHQGLSSQQMSHLTNSLTQFLKRY
jgi:CDP-6-deoxy-D-xylo-4-hexulose-3-dehydrase